MSGCSRLPGTPAVATAAAALLLVAVGVAPCARAAEDAAPATKLEEVERNLGESRERFRSLDESAKRAERELREIKLRAVAVARELHRRDEAVRKIEKSLAELGRKADAARERLDDRREQLGITLAALQRIARLPAATLVAIPQAPDATIRSAILLRSAVPGLHREAQALRDQIAELAMLREAIRDDRKALAAAHGELEIERDKLAALIERKREVAEKTRKEERKAAQRVARLSEEAGNLRELIEKLKTERAVKTRLRAPDFEPPPVSGEIRSPVPLRETGPRGPLPAPGRVVTAFGAELPNGRTNKGLWIETRRAATVVAPLAGRVVFAGRFRGYGNLVILQVDDDSHVLMAGMATINAQVGDEALAGEPVGEMTLSTGDAPTLYFELRRRGQPVNPMPLLTARRNKVDG